VDGAAGLAFTELALFGRLAGAAVGVSGGASSSLDDASTRSTALKLAGASTAGASTAGDVDGKFTGADRGATCS